MMVTTIIITMISSSSGGNIDVSIENSIMITITVLPIVSRT
jgi:hypothetical protein